MTSMTLWPLSDLDLSASSLTVFLCNRPTKHASKQILAAARIGTRFANDAAVSGAAFISLSNRRSLVLNLADFSQSSVRSNYVNSVRVCYWSYSFPSHLGSSSRCFFEDRCLLLCFLPLPVFPAQQIGFCGRSAESIP